MSLNKSANFASGYNFNFHCPRLPVCSELVQDVLVPALSLNEALVPNRFQDYSIAGEKIEWGEIDVGISIDANLDAYTEIFQWMKELAPTESEQPASRTQKTADCTLQILNNNKRVIRTFKFYDCWPTSLGAMSMDLTSPNLTKSILSLKYTYFDITPMESGLGGLTKKPVK